MSEIGIIHDTTELRKLIAENPDLPIAIMVGQEAASEDYSYTYCTDVRCRVGEILDHELPFGEGHIFEDRIEFEEQLAEFLIDGNEHMSDNDFDLLVETAKGEYNEYWKKAIIVIADN